MTTKPTVHHRRSIRLKGYDYTQAGAYFITLCTHNRLPLFGEIVNGEMQLNEYGRIAHGQWQQIPARFEQIELSAFVIMPDGLSLLPRLEAAVGPMDVRKHENAKGAVFYTAVPIAGEAAPAEKVTQ